MSRVFSIVLAIVSILMLGVVVVSSDSNPDPPSNNNPIYLPIVNYSPPGSTLEDPGAATDLQSRVDCEGPGNAIAELTWALATTPGDEQRVEVTIYRNGFETGEFETSKPLGGDQSSLVWELVETGLNHRWRVLTLQANEWSASETAIFKGPICVGDPEPPPAEPIP
jgi:hypothetical protein